MNNTILSSKNTFSEGLIMDFAPDNTQSNCLTSALNATLLTFNGNEMSLLNDMGNGRVETARLPDGYVPVGSCEFGDIIYIVSYNPILNKSLIGCFPSPERNISSEEIGDTKQTLSASDFQYLDNGSPTGKLKNSSVKKVLYDNKDMTSGDKYIIYSKDINDNSQYLSDFENESHKYGTFPKLVKIHVVSIEDSGKIVYLDSTTKWYDNNYFINGDGKLNADNKLDIDSYRSLVTSAYSIFSSKVSGKLALLVELEKITGFSCSWEPYVKNKTDKYIDYDIFWNFNWTTNDNNINPNGALLTHSKWVSNSTIKLPDVNTEFGPSILFNRNYKPEENINYNNFIENYEYNKYLSNTLSSLTNTGITPYKVVIGRNNTGVPIPGKYYVNCTHIINQADVLTISNSDKKNFNNDKYVNTYVDKNYDIYVILEKQMEVGYLGPISNIQCLTNSNNLLNIRNLEDYNINSICDSFNGYYISAYSRDSIWSIFHYNNGTIIQNKFDSESDKNILDMHCLGYNNGILYASYIKNNQKYVVGYDESFKIVFNKREQISFPASLIILYDKSDNSLVFLKIKNSTTYIVYKQFIVNNILDKKLLLGTVNVEEEYSLKINLVEKYLYISQYKNSDLIISKNELSNYKAYTINSTGEEIQISSKTIKDDIINNYFNYSVIKPFTVMNSKGKLENFIFRIPNDENNLIYHYKIAPTMPYGYLEEYTQEGYIDFNKIGKKNIKLHTWKYYNYENTSTLTWGMDAYTEEGKGIQEVVFEFYDNQGFAAAYHVKDKNSFNGTFTDYILLNNFGSNYKLNNYNYKNLRKYHKSIQITAGNAEEGKTYLTEENNPIYNIVDSSELIYEDDCGILYPNCLYLVKIIVKYSSKDILGNYTESESEYVYDYRWYWTNSMFNKHYQNELDFNNLLFELGLNCITHLYTSPTYQVNRINYGPDTIDDVESINNTLSANILYVNLDNEQKDNIRLSITPGLLNDFNTFNLNQAKVNELKASIYLGDEYITNIVEQPNVIYSEHKITDDVEMLTPISSTPESSKTENTKLPLLESPSIYYSEDSGEYTITHNNINVHIYYSINGGEYNNSGTNIVSLSESDIIDIATYAKYVTNGELDKVYLDSPVVVYQKENKARVILEKYSNTIEDELVGGSGSLNLDLILPPTILPLGCSFTESENLNITITGKGIIYYKIVPKDKKQEEFNYTEISPNETDINKITIGIGDSCTVYAYIKNGRATSSTISQKYTKESIPEISNTDNENHINSILGSEVSRTLYTKLGLQAPSSNLGEELYNGNHKSYVNTFKLVPYVTDDKSWEYESESQDSIPYQSSSGELKTTNGLTKYSTLLSNVLLKDGKYFPLSLSGIHYSKYTYEIKLSENVPIIRSFVLNASDLENYNIRIYDEKPYFNKMLFTSYVDDGGQSSEQHTAILSFVKDSKGYAQSDKLILDTYKGDDAPKISVYSGLNINYDSISNNFKFLFPFGYGHGYMAGGDDANYTRAYRKDTNVDELVSNNKYWHVTSTDPYYKDGDLGGTIAGITEETIHPANQHKYKNALEEFAPPVLGMLTQLYYILNSNNNINVPYNYIYLEPNKYSYKRDLIVGISPNIENHNDLILFRGMYYSDLYENGEVKEQGYVSQVIENSGLDDIKESLKSHINVKLKLESLMLTSPLEYNADYITPEQEGESNYYLVKSVFDDMDNKVKMSAINDDIYGWDHVSKSFVPYRSLQTIKKIEKVHFNNSLISIKSSENNNIISLRPIIDINALTIGSDNSLMLKRIPDSIATYSVTTHDTKNHTNDNGKDKYRAMINYKKFTFYNE